MVTEEGRYVYATQSFCYKALHKKALESSKTKNNYQKNNNSRINSNSQAKKQIETGINPLKLTPNSRADGKQAN